MTSRDEPFDRTMRSWMAGEASQDGADGIQRTVLDAARRRRQRPTWLVALRGTAWDRDRGATRSVPSPRILALLAMLVIVAAGLGVVGGGAFRSDDGGLLLPSPSTAPSATTNPTPAPRATPRVDLPAPLPSRPPLDESVVAYLAAHGQSAFPVPAARPDPAVSAALRKLLVKRFYTVDYYAVVTCIDPSKGCLEVGSTGLGDQRGIWFAYGDFIRAVDAVTLEQIPINGY